jgi:hypothetical protein
VDATTKVCLVDFQEKVVPPLEKTKPVYDVGLWGSDTCPTLLYTTMAISSFLIKQTKVSGVQKISKHILHTNPIPFH